MNGDSWGILPPDIMDIIVHKLLRLTEFSAAKIIRLVSKAWLASFERYPATLTLSEEYEVTLKTLLKIAPNLIGLEYMRPITRNRTLQPISTLNKLTRLVVDGIESFDSEWCIDLHHFPVSLATAELSRIRIGSRYMDRMNCPKLTSLAMVDLKIDVNEHWVILQHVPQLKVSQHCFFKMLQISLACLQACLELMLFSCCVSSS